MNGPGHQPFACASPAGLWGVASHRVEGGEIMKSGTKVALAMGAGYLLGRKHRMRLALMLGAAAATGRLPSSPAELLERGLGSAGVGKAGDLGGRLAEVGKAAAVTVASSQIDSLTDRLHSRAESLRQAGKAGDESEEEEAEETRERASSGEQERPEPEEEYDEEPSDEDESSEEEEEEEPEAPRGRSEAGRGSRERRPVEEVGQESDADVEDSDAEDSDEEPERERRRPVKSRGSRAASPIQRGRR